MEQILQHDILSISISKTSPYTVVLFRVLKWFEQVAAGLSNCKFPIISPPSWWFPRSEKRLLWPINRHRPRWHVISFPENISETLPRHSVLLSISSLRLASSSHWIYLDKNTKNYKFTTACFWKIVCHYHRTWRSQSKIKFYQMISTLLWYLQLFSKIFSYKLQLTNIR